MLQNAGELKRYSRHDVAQLIVLKGVLLFKCIKHVPAYIPTRACYRRADDGVRSLTDNVPNRVEMATGRPFRKTYPVKG